MKRRHDITNQLSEKKQQLATIILERQHAEKQLEKAIQDFSFAIQNSHQREQQAVLHTDLDVAKQKADHQLAVDELTRLKTLEQTLFQELIVLEKTCEEANTTESFDFVHRFLDQTIDQEPDIAYDSSIPFEDRPAVPPPSKPQIPKGHITWDVS